MALARSQALFLMLMFQATVTVVGQGPTQGLVTMGPEIVHRKQFPSPICELGSDRHGYYVQREAPSNEISIERYGEDLTLQSSSTFKPELNGSELEHWYLFRMKDRINVLARSVDRSTDTATFHVCAIDPASMRPDGKWSTLGKVDTKGRKPTVDFYTGVRGTTLEFSSKDRSTEAQFSSNPSADGAYRVFYTDYAMEDREQDVYDLVLMNDQLATIWKLTLALPEPETEFSLGGMTVGKDGMVYIYGQRCIGGEDMVIDGKPNYVKRIYGVNSTGIVFDATVDLGDQFIENYAVRLRGDELVVSGFYSEAEPYHARGMFFMRFDARTGVILAQNEQPFKEEVFTQLYGPKEGVEAYGKFLKAKKNGVDHLKFSELLALPNGGHRLIAEREWRETYTSSRTSPGSNPRISYTKTSAIPEYHTEQMLLLDIAPDGAIAQSAAVLKQQQILYENNYSSYVGTPVQQDGGQLFVFNDHPSNLEEGRLQEGDVKKWIGGKGCISLVELGPDGSQQRRALIDIKEEEMALYTTVSIRVSENEKLVLCRYKTNERWMRLRW